TVNLPLFFVGLFPKEQYWRTWCILSLLAGLSGLSWGVLLRQQAPLFSKTVLIGLALSALLIALTPITGVYRFMLTSITLALILLAWLGKWLRQYLTRVRVGLGVAWFACLLAMLWLMRGGFGLAVVPSDRWGGLLLTCLITIVSALTCFPLGILLALGRRSQLPVVKWLSVLYIELIRGVPLITILFMGQVMVPMVFPPGVRPDRILRAMIGLTLFSAAYMAENIRGGLQAIPRGQFEAAQALGLNSALTTILVVLPQALKISIPAMVNQFIGIFQNTTLLAIVGLVEFLGIARSILAQPEFIGRYSEVYLFVGVISWLLCCGMSMGSRRLETTLNRDSETQYSRL
ncbi:MAG: amino acid ABC transporter permease, partial [Cyanobacteria bacterium P01_H01_bin.121]